MKITAVTKFKQGDLWNALQKAGWTQSELARKTNIGIGSIGDYCNLKRKPITDHANKIQEALGSVGVFVDVLSIWPADFVGVKEIVTIQQTQEIDINLLQSNPHELHDTCKPDIEFVRNKLNESLNLAFFKRTHTWGGIDRLDEREKYVIDQRFLRGKTLNEISRKLPINKERIRQIEQKALRKLRHPERIKYLNEARAALCPLRMSFV